LKGVVFPYRSAKELPDVFIYLIERETPICFVRIKAEDLFLSDKNPLGIDFVKHFTPDISIRDTDYDKAGIIKLRMGI